MTYLCCRCSTIRTQHLSRHQVDLCLCPTLSLAGCRHNTHTSNDWRQMIHCVQNAVTKNSTAIMKLGHDYTFASKKREEQNSFISEGRRLRFWTQTVPTLIKVWHRVAGFERGGGLWRLSWLLDRRLAVSEGTGCNNAELRGIWKVFGSATFSAALEQSWSATFTRIHWF